MPSPGCPANSSASRARASQRSAAARASASGKAWPRQLAGDGHAERELADRQVGRRAGEVAVLGEDLEPALLRLGGPALDQVEVAEQDVDRHAVDGEPRPAVDDRAPLAELGDVAVVPEPPHVLGVERAAVVDAEVPVAVGPVRARRARAPERDGDRAGQRGELGGQGGDGVREHARSVASTIRRCPRSRLPATAPARANRSSSSTASPRPGACWLPGHRRARPALRRDRADVARPRRRPALPPDGPAHTIARRGRPLRELLDELGIDDRALRRQLDGRRAVARAGQARPRTQRRRDLPRRRLASRDDAEEPSGSSKWFARNQQLAPRPRRHAARDRSGRAPAASRCATS